MPLFALIMFPLGVGVEVEVLCHCQPLLVDCLFVISVLLILQKSTRERERKRKIFATSQSCLVVSTPALGDIGPTNVNNLFMVLFVYFFARWLPAHLSAVSVSPSLSLSVSCLRSA